MVGGASENSTATGVREAGNQLMELSIAGHMVDIINDLQEFHDRLCSPQDNSCISDIEEFNLSRNVGLCSFRLLGAHISCVEKDEPSIGNLTIMKFICSIVENKELHEKLNIFNYFLQCFSVLPYYAYYEQMRFQLNGIVTDFRQQNLKDKMRLLVLLREKMDFADIQKAYDGWCLSDLICDSAFKQMYVDKAAEERERPISENLKENIEKYASLAAQGKQIANKYFEKGIDFQAYCEEAGNDGKTLNVNLVDYNGSEPIKISDILQQEGNIGELNIYCNRKHDICARREDKKRHYKFEKGACYQMTSTWPIKDKSGEMVTCTMVMNVGSDGITETLEFSGEGPDGKNYQFSPEKNKGLIKKNEELYIQGSPLCEAVGKLLKLRRGKEAVCGVESIVPINESNEYTGVMPATTNNSSQDAETTGVDREPDEKLKGQGLADSGATTPTDNGASTPTEVNLQDNGTQTGTDLQQQKIEELAQNHPEFRKALNRACEKLGRLMQNSEDAEGGVRKHRLQNSRMLKLENEVEELRRRADEVCEGVRLGERKIKSLESQLKGICGYVLSEKKPPYICINSDSGTYHLGDPLSSDEESEDSSKNYYGSDEEPDNARSNFPAFNTPV